MARYTTTPPVSGVYIPDLGSFQADADGVFDLPETPLVAQAMAEVGVTLTPVLAAPPNPPPANPDPPPANPDPTGAATVQGGDAGEGSQTSAGSEGADPKGSRRKG